MDGCTSRNENVCAEKSRHAASHGARKFVAGLAVRCSAPFCDDSVPFEERLGHALASYWCSLAVLMVNLQSDVRHSTQVGKCTDVPKANVRVVSVEHTE